MLICMHTHSIFKNWYKSNRKHSAIFKQNLSEIKQPKHSTIDIYTYGWKDQNKVAATAVITNNVFFAGLPNEAAVYMPKHRLFSFGLSTLKYLMTNILHSIPRLLILSTDNKHIDHWYVLNVLNQYYILTKQGKIVEICWIPMHIVMNSNTNTDKAVKHAL